MTATLRTRLQRLSEKSRANEFDVRTSFWTATRTEAERLIASARNASNDAVANEAWFLSTFADSKRMFLGAYGNIRAKRFFEGWRLLERTEIALKGLSTNAFLDLQQFGVLSFRQLVESWQKLYPYRFFFSPEFRIRRQECSLCGQSFSPWTDCGHRVGRVYAGQFCCSIIKDATIPSISLVLNPVQKYSVVFPNNRDDYDY
jgi:hypothetical protein